MEDPWVWEEMVFEVKVVECCMLVEGAIHGRCRLDLLAFEQVCEGWVFVKVGQCLGMLEPLSQATKATRPTSPNPQT